MAGMKALRFNVGDYEVVLKAGKYGHTPNRDDTLELILDAALSLWNSSNYFRNENLPFSSKKCSSQARELHNYLVEQKYIQEDED